MLLKFQHYKPNEVKKQKKLLQVNAKHNIISSKQVWETSSHSATWTGQRGRHTLPAPPWTVGADAPCMYDQAETPVTVHIAIRVYSAEAWIHRQTVKGVNRRETPDQPSASPHVCV